MRRQLSLPDQETGEERWRRNRRSIFALLQKSVIFAGKKQRDKTEMKETKTTSILFVCLGNICRSPAAQAVMEHLAELRGVDHLFEIDSAGIGAWHTGQLPDHRMREHGSRRGYSFTHRARQVKREDFGRFNYIIGMDEENLHDLRRVAATQENARKIRCLADFLRQHPGQTTVPDPYYGGPQDFELALDLIEDACDGLLEALLAHSAI